MCGYLKKMHPDCKITFLGRTYTGPVINCCTAVDTFLNYDELEKLALSEQIEKLKELKIDTIIHVYPKKAIADLAKRAGIKIRIGTTNRIPHWLYCNKLVKLSRKKSDLHEAQLNIRLLEPLGIKHIPAINELPEYYCFRSAEALPAEFAALLGKDKINIILHPKSAGSGREWDITKFAELITLLPPDKYRVFISGSQKEKELLKDWITKLPKHVVDITGKLTLPQFITFIANADGLIASGTGPLHIAAETGINAIGLFPSVKRIHAGRWGPIGKKAVHIESGQDSLDSISAKSVFNKIKDWIIGER
ncbi:glycosyl transferase family 9 [Mucilaginibacter sp. HMF5004]|nr:glycosyl transferase family 9 [Mucilaginibacter rivuli]